MKISRLYVFLVVGFCMQVAKANGELSEQVMADEVPANVKNAFNRIYIDHDPDAWYLTVVKPKGEKKSKRFTATFDNEGRTHSVRFNEAGRPIGEYYLINHETSQHIIDRIANDFPSYEISRVESVWLFSDNLSAFKVALDKKGKSEVVFVDDAGNQLYDEVLYQEFVE